MASTISFGDANTGFQAGVIHGPVKNTFHFPPGATVEETPPHPAGAIPFSRDNDFVSRGHLFGRIQQKCAARGSRTALVGLGGVGKSQLAIELAHQTREQRPQTWVFWAHASNAARLEQSFRDIASCVRLFGRQDPTADIFQLVHDWLRDERKGTWMLILDNVDDAGFLLEPRNHGSDGQAGGSDGTKSIQPLISYVPQCQNGSVLVTTRSRTAALKLVEERDIIVVEPMDKSDALALLHKKLGQEESSDGANEEVVELAAALEFMPLAMVQAAAYISRRRPRCSVQQYLRDFRKSDRKKTSLLDCEGGQLRRDWQAKNSIIITWQISFDYIRETRPSAADLLALMSFHDRQGIPEDLLRFGAKEETAHQDQNECHGDHDDLARDDDIASYSSASDEPDGFEDDILTLHDYSFISIDKDATTFVMHELVQLATRKWLEIHGQLEQWKEQFMKNLCAAFPIGLYENWTRCQQLFPHAKSAARLQPEGVVALENWATILHNAGLYAWRKGNISEARKMPVQAMETRKKILGQEHQDTLKSMALVGRVYKLKGQWQAAEELELKVMDACKRTLSVNHPDTLASMCALASTYRERGRWEDAEALQVKVLEIQKETLGKDHSDTLVSMAELASTYRSQGRWEAAEVLQMEVLEIRVKTTGADHPDTLASRSNLASMYWDQGRLEAAEAITVEVVETQKKNLGVDHPDTLISMGNLAVTYVNRGRWDAAEPLQMEVMETLKKNLGGEHPYTLTSMNNLALTYWYQGRLEAAEALNAEVIKTHKKKLGADHPDALTCMNNLALIYMSQGRWKAAEALQMEVIETQKKKFGADHPLTLISIGNLALTYWEQGRLEAAEALNVEVIETKKKKLGVDHPDTLASMNNLASTYCLQWRLESAEALQVEVMEASKTKLGMDHPDTLTSMNNLSSTYMRQDRWEAAEALLVEVIEASKKRLGVDHLDTLTSMGNLALTYMNQGRWKAAEALQVEVMEARMTKLGIDHPATLISIENLESTYRGQGSGEAAIALRVRVMETRKKASGTGKSPKHAG